MIRRTRQFEFGDEQLPGEMVAERAETVAPSTPAEDSWPPDPDRAEECEDAEPTAELAYAPPSGQPTPDDRRAPDADRESWAHGGWRRAQRLGSRLPRRAPGLAVAVAVGVATFVGASLLLGGAPDRDAPRDVVRRPGGAAAPQGPAVSAAAPGASGRDRAQQAQRGARRPPSRRRASHDPVPRDAAERRPAPAPATGTPAPAAPTPATPAPAPSAPAPAPAPAAPAAPVAAAPPAAAEAEFGFER